MLEGQMSRRISALGAWTLCAVLGVFVLSAQPAEAAPKAKPKPAAQSKPPKNQKKPPPKPEATEDADAKAADDDKTDAKSDKGEPSGVKAAGTSGGKGGANASSATAVKETKESKEGVKTYKFGTIEVEGRLKSPQIIYFLRRVRAEFDAGALGHRSFMRELSDTRNNPALR